MEICNGVDYLDQVKELIIEYTKRLGRDLSFQNIDEELENLAKKIYSSWRRTFSSCRKEKGDRNGCLSSPFKESLWNETFVCKTRI